MTLRAPICKMLDQSPADVFRQQSRHYTTSHPIAICKPKIVVEVGEENEAVRINVSSYIAYPGI